MLPVICAPGVITNKINASLYINRKVNRYFIYLFSVHQFVVAATGAFTLTSMLTSWTPFSVMLGRVLISSRTLYHFHIRHQASISLGPPSDRQPNAIYQWWSAIMCLHCRTVCFSLAALIQHLTLHLCSMTGVIDT